MKTKFQRMTAPRKDLRGGESEEDAERKVDIEEHEHTISGNTATTVKIRLFWTHEDPDESECVTTFAECTCNKARLASALARCIHREGMRSEFWERMEEPSEQMCDVAFEVFDRYGTVNLKYKRHPVQRGTGIWGDELDHGPLFLIENVHIIALELRRKGLGQKIVSLLLEFGQTVLSQ
ncbi:hypothetical protein BJY01DRAFT_254163 [Aspergillus pseudoustus]|uniref:N-acetyltransferase domain-containing protein n=1 Tax=Aspergillus pseudoustus TaxID=1810923 RepID=A0ABR4IV52_9EURO